MNRISRFASTVVLAALFVSFPAFARTWDLTYSVTCSAAQGDSILEELEKMQATSGFQVTGTKTKGGIDLKIVATDPNGLIDVEYFLHHWWMSTVDAAQRQRGFGSNKRPLFLDAIEEGGRHLPLLARSERFQTLVNLKFLSGISAEALKRDYGIEGHSQIGEILVIEGTREQLVKVIAEKGFHPYDPDFGGTPPGGCHTEVKDAK